MDSFEYAIKKDVRNNSIVRELDQGRQLEQWKWMGTAALLVLVLLFAVWQRAELRRLGSKISTMQRQMVVEEETGRHLLLDLESLQSPKRIAQFATERLHMVDPRPEDSIVIERVRPSAPPGPIRRCTAMTSLIQRLERLLPFREAKVVREPLVDWRTTLKARVAVSTLLIAMWAVGIQAKLVYLQVFQRTELEARARAQQQSTLVVPGTRADLLDRQGRRLATSADTESIVFVVPSKIDDKAAVVAVLCGALADCSQDDRDTLLTRFMNPKFAAYARVKRQASADQLQRVAALNLGFVGVAKENRRYYPNNELAAHLLGWVGTDNDGQGGIEFAYNKTIRGKEGQVVIQTDARRTVLSRVETRPPTPGSSLELTIDRDLQYVVERELHAGVVANHAESGSAIVMIPQTGEILAMANEPTFNPNAVGGSSENDRRNRAVQDVYEPGSTFKIVTASAAIEEKLFAPDAVIDAGPGLIRLAGNRIVDEYQGHNYGVLSFTDVIVKSSNVGAIKIGFRVGIDRMSDYVRRFGFGRPVSTDFPAENPGKVYSADALTEGGLASMSMGYQVSVTPLQMLAAASVVANGGLFVEPRIVRAEYRNGRRIAVRPNVERRVISADTAATLTAIMEGVVERGTATRAQMAGFTIAGKTGTASKLVNGRYSNTNNYASFVGFLPSSKPAVSIIVMLDSPHGNGSSGGVVAAPIFKRIGEAVVRQFGIVPTVNPDPPVLVAQVHESVQVAKRASIAPTVSLVSDAAPGTVPDLRGMSVRDAARTLAGLGIFARPSGDGLVVAQNPPPGTPFQAGSSCQLVLARAPAKSAVSPMRP